jgi:hypothetical protein
MHTLTFKCIPGDVLDVTTPEGHGPLRDVDVQAFLDGKPMSRGLIDVGSLIFGTPVDRCDFYFFTCSCGHAGCNGYHLPLEHRREDDRIVWKIEDEKLAAAFGAEEIIFSAAQLDDAVAQLRTDLEALEAKGHFATPLQEVDFTADGDEFHFGVTLAQAAEHEVPYFQKQGAFHKLLDSNADPEDPTMVRFYWGRPQHDEASELFTEMRAVEAAANLLRLHRIIDDEDAPKVAKLSEATKIVEEFSRSGDADRAQQEFSPLLSFMREEYLEGEDETVFGIDTDGPFVRHP